MVYAYIICKKAVLFCKATGKTRFHDCSFLRKICVVLTLFEIFIEIVSEIFELVSFDDCGDEKLMEMLVVGSFVEEQGIRNHWEKDIDFLFFIKMLGK